MATVYWYYRPEDVDQVTATYFHDVSLMRMVSLILCSKIDSNFNISFLNLIRMS